jgi:hypothetical protein
MFRIALEFGRTPHVALDQHGLRDAAERDRARVEQRAARDDVLGLADVGNDRFRRLLRTRPDAGQRERRAHQAEEVAPTLRVVPLGRLLGELPVQVLAELGSVRQLAEAPPVQAALGAGQAGSDGCKVHAHLSASSFQLEPRSLCVLMTVLTARPSSLQLEAGSSKLAAHL